MRERLMRRPGRSKGEPAELEDRAGAVCLDCEIDVLGVRSDSVHVRVDRAA
jgi:hypothetical protein